MPAVVGNDTAVALGGVVDDREGEVALVIANRSDQCLQVVHPSAHMIRHGEKAGLVSLVEWSNGAFATPGGLRQETHKWFPHSADTKGEEEKTAERQCVR